MMSNFDTPPPPTPSRSLFINSLLQIKDTIQKAHASLVSLAQNRNYLTAVGVLKEGDNNRQSRKAAACVGPRVVSLAELCTSKRKEDIESIQEFHQSMTALCLI